jgi:hypothetical protein
MIMLADKYRNYSTRVGEDCAIPACYEDRDGRLIRYHFRIYRVPSRNEFLLRHLAGSTRDERKRAERMLANMPKGAWANFPDACWFKRRNRAEGHYFWKIEIGYPVSDPLVQLELEMMIDLHSETVADEHA